MVLVKKKSKSFAKEKEKKNELCNLRALGECREERGREERALCW